ncbi:MULTISPECIES: hypothetical protein [unclassified Pseudomonas]|jgi:hypothetical protein|uniref:hypothetical protein n=1 Tax=unclassified Pseudomonas TaxID=196821 RepID=UPI0002894EC8|nr:MULTISPECIES: hypothetical protein [unclassified Pseudomonas]QJI37600.1 hypothetical protein HKK54_25400 [Pseudomonas sp. ADAK13]
MSTTLLCWCRDDSQLTAAARNFRADYRYSGCRRAALPQTLGRLRNGDVLVITAHGSPQAFGEEGVNFTDFTPRQFADALLANPPGGWSGSLYFDICNGYAFAQNVRPLIRAGLPNLRLFGCEGDTDMAVDLSRHREATA